MANKAKDKEFRARCHPFVEEYRVGVITLREALGHMRAAYREVYGRDELNEVAAKRSLLVPAINSLAELRMKSGTDNRYARLAVTAARNLGGNIKDEDTAAAYRFLSMTAGETSEDGVVKEINYVRDCI